MVVWSGVDGGVLVSVTEVVRTVSGGRRRLLGGGPGGGRDWVVFLLLVVPVAYVVVFFAFPAALMVGRSFFDPELGLGNYVALFTDGITLTLLWRTLWLSALVTVLTLLVGYPFAYALTVASPRVRAVLLLVVLLPFWLSLVARSFAWVAIFQRGGVLDTALSAIGIDGVVLLGSLPAVLIGMTHVLQPFMVLPLFSAMSGIDRGLLRASESLGASRWRTFFQVYLPLSKPGVVAGSLLVMMLSVGFYVTPALLGSPRESLIARLIDIRAREMQDFGSAAAIATALMLVMVVLVAVVSALTGERRSGGLWRKGRSR